MCSFLIRDQSRERFAFCSFLMFLNLDRLIENLKTIWIGRFHLSANTARFERPKASTFQKEKPVPSGNVTGFKQPIVQNQGRPKESYSSILKPSLVLDDSCLVNRDLTNCVMGEVLQFSSINNLQVLLSNEGFHNTRVVYLGGLWVMIELKSSKSKSKFMEHVGVASWFRRLWFRAAHGESIDRRNRLSPFNIYNLLDKLTKEVRTTDTSTSIPYPPGFTPANDIPASNNQDIPEAESDRPPSRSARSNSRVLEEAEKLRDIALSESFSNGVKIKEGGSILEILEEMITVGQTMGFSMEGCTKDMEKIIGTQGKNIIFR
ncbi:hypothetical protein Tco_0977595 [Tanacetum coccineum]|uniref:RNA-directed DNA polymerase, eukaryota n=1 Tax=Tanacetum coccineum TaxID=301880 RepID=A0ABQ5EKI4_9ASTR